MCRVNKKMGKNKSCSPQEREIIHKMYLERKNASEVAKLLQISRGKVRNAINHFKTHQTFSNLRRKKARKTTQRDDTELVRMSKRDPFLTSTQIRAKMQEEHGVNISARTVRRRLNENELRGCIAKCKPLVSKKNLRKRLNFAKEHIGKPQKFWDLIVWSDESKFNVFGNDGRPYVRRPPRKELDPKYTKNVVKYGGSSVMVWGCFSSRGVGPLVKIDGIMTGIGYKDILAEHFDGEYSENLPLKFIFQQDNDPKHCSKIVKKWFKDNKINVLDWPAQSPDLNPIENLWAILKRAVSIRKPQRKDDLWQILQEEWEKITPETCAKLAESIPKRCQRVIQNHGYPTEY